VLETLRAAVRGAHFLGQLAKRAGEVAWGLARDLGKSTAQLRAENAALRAQLAVLKRQVGRASPDAADRVVLVAVDRFFPAAMANTLHLVRPETLLRWHRDFARWLWAWRCRPKSARRRSPRRTREEIRHLVIDMAKANGWGALKIVGELRKLGIEVGRTTVQRILEAEWPEGRPEPTQSWGTFVRNHLEGTWACDFFTVTTLGFRSLYVLFFLRLDTRELVHVAVTEHPTGDWTTQQLRNACWEGAPERLIRDRDTKFTSSFDAIVEGEGGEVLLTPPRTPVANCFAERQVGTFRRELFDRVVPRDEEHVRELLRA
jgi:putative transposase